MTRRRNVDPSESAYARASGRDEKSAARSVKAQVYAHGKDVERAASPATRSGAGEAARRAVPTGQAREALESAPINNMGVTEDFADRALHEIALSHAVDLVMTADGEVKQVMVRVPTENQRCVIDWVNFTVLEDTWFKSSRGVMVDDESILREASFQLERIFGFGITEDRNRGMNFYKNSWVLGDNFGFVCYGGQRATMLVTLTGHGCLNALPGWEKRLHQFLTTVAIRPTITRCDLAHDDIEGAYLSCDWAEQQWHKGGYTPSAGGIAPHIERVGNWHRPSGKGRTLTVGRRTSGKFVRFYEKGKKEGDASSLWLRCEVEYKSCDRVIPFEILLNPSDYFSATYPCFVEFAHVETPVRITIKQKTAELVIAACIDVTKHQFGKYLRVFRELYGDKGALDLVCNPDKDAWPKRMKPLTTDALTGGTPIHRQPRPAAGAAWMEDGARWVTEIIKTASGGARLTTSVIRA